MRNWPNEGYPREGPDQLKARHDFFEKQSIQQIKHARVLDNNAFIERIIGSQVLIVYQKQAGICPLQPSKTKIDSP